VRLSLCTNSYSIFGGTIVTWRRMTESITSTQVDQDFRIATVRKTLSRARIVSYMRFSSTRTVLWPLTSSVILGFLLLPPPPRLRILCSSIPVTQWVSERIFRIRKRIPIIFLVPRSILISRTLPRRLIRPCSLFRIAPTRRGKKLSCC
jgi:hypothetical protein